ADRTDDDTRIRRSRDQGIGDRARSPFFAAAVRECRHILLASIRLVGGCRTHTFGVSAPARLLRPKKLAVTSNVMHGRLDSCIQAAIGFLEGRQGKSGFWSDFSTLAGESDEWVTAYVGESLAFHPASRRPVTRALQVLLRRRP